MVIKVKKDDDLIFFGESVCVEEIIGLSPDEFLKIFNCLQKYGLNINKIYYPIEEYFKNKNVKNYDCNSIIYDILEFVFLCNELKQQKVKIYKLLREFNKSQNESIDSVRHDVTVARICYEYIKEDYEIELYPKHKSRIHPDLKINQLYCDIKMEQEAHIIELLGYKVNKLKNNSAITFKRDKVRQEKVILIAEKWLEKYDVVFNDISYSIIEGGFGRLCDSRTQLTPIEPIKNRVIVLSYNKYTSLEKPNIKWTYYDWDPINQEFIL